MKQNSKAKMILGIDPAINNMGWGIIRIDNTMISYVDSGVVRNNANNSVVVKLLNIHNQLQNIISSYKPNEISIEETFVNVNPASSLVLGQARGAIILSCSLLNLPIFEYSATKVKKSLVGNGRAEKEQVKSMLKFLLPKITKELTDDESDALAIAICHANNSSLIYENFGK